MIIGKDKSKFLIKEFESRVDNVLHILKNSKDYENKDSSNEVNVNGSKYYKQDLCIININDLKYSIADLKVIINRIEKIKNESIL